MGGQYESCKCVETKYKGKPLKGPKPPKETYEFSSLAEALAAVKAEEAGDDATWMPLAALISAEMFHQLGDRVGYSIQRPPAVRGGLEALLARFVAFGDIRSKSPPDLGDILTGYLQERSVRCFIRVPALHHIAMSLSLVIARWCSLGHELNPCVGEDERRPGGERVRVDELGVLRAVWAEYDEWDDDYEWQADSEGVFVELDLADGTALVSFDE